jgi:hypothetical protein
MDEREEQGSSRDGALRLAEEADTQPERDYYLAVADALINSYGHGTKIADAIQGRK